MGSWKKGKNDDASTPDVCIADLQLSEGRFGPVKPVEGVLFCDWKPAVEPPVQKGLGFILCNRSNHVVLYLCAAVVALRAL